MTREIQLTQGYVALVDDEDYEWLRRWKWYAVVKERGRVCAMRRGHRQGKNTTIYMHSEIVGAKPGQQVDHRNGDALDNRRGNLRACPNAQNSQNRRANTGRSSKYKGVCWNKARGKWQAEICIDWKKKYLGRFDTEREAALAYDAAGRELFGEFARLNLSTEKAAYT